MATQSRHGKRWTVSEILSLEREYELLGWTIKQIAEKHQRSESSIMFKLESEGLMKSTFVSTKKTIAKKTIDEDDVSDTDSSSDYDEKDAVSEVSDDESNSEVFDNLSARVWNLESNVSQIGTMVKQLLDQMVTKKTSKKLAPLRRV